MPGIALDAQALLAHRLEPALVLDSTGVVTASNDACLRLICSSNTCDTLANCHISQLGLVPVPNGLPVLWIWSDVLAAARHTLPSHPHDVPPSRRNFTPAINQETDDFWNQEHQQQAIVETDIYVTRTFSKHATIEASDLLNIPGMVRACANVCWYEQGQDGLYLVTFKRPSVSQAPVLTPSTTPSEPTDHVFDTPEMSSTFTCGTCRKSMEDSFFDMNSNFEEFMPGASDIASSIIPYIMSVLDTEGQVLRFSSTWYRFSGLNEEQSLGSGWIASVHPDDVVEVTTSWAEVHRNKRSHWTHQARYRKASDGLYYWFLIRAQPFCNAQGEIIRWYASMMDINEWVNARLEADRRRQSILTLFSQTDVMLWGIDPTHHMYICEGRLGWNPAKLEQLLTGRANKESTDQNKLPEDKCSEELLETVLAVLQGREFQPIVEHWEGDRYYRTRFIAERTSSVGGARSALALTFDVTDERARATLRSENERLVSNEKVALDSNKLKSRFLANVSSCLSFTWPVSNVFRCLMRSGPQFPVSSV